MKQRGTLIQSMGEVTFRVYHNTEDFTDYDIRACDMEIVIDDQFVTTKKDKDGNDYIDYTNAVLGTKE